MEGHEGIAVGADERRVHLGGDFPGALGEAALVPRLMPEGYLPLPVRGRDGYQRNVYGPGFVGALVVCLEGEREGERRVWGEALVLERSPDGTDEVLYVHLPAGVEERREIELRDSDGESGVSDLVGAVSESANYGERLLGQRHDDAVAVGDDGGCGLGGGEAALVAFLPSSRLHLGYSAGACQPPRADSRRAATARDTSSRQGRVIAWTPMGKPSSDVPQRTTVPGQPVRL